MLGIAKLFAGTPLSGLVGLLVATGLVFVPVPLVAKERDLAREAVTNLEAYAVYKMGRYDEAKAIWEGLAAKGNTTALINLANLFQQGQGVSEDQKQALDYVRQAAELGDARAQFELGMAYETGHVLGRDIDLAASWLKKSAEQDFSDAQFSYGVMVATNKGAGLETSSPEQKAEALEWLKKAKSGGNLEAADYIPAIEKLTK